MRFPVQAGLIPISGETPPINPKQDAVLGSMLVSAAFQKKCQIGVKGNQRRYIDPFEPLKSRPEQRITWPLWLFPSIQITLLTAEVQDRGQADLQTLDEAPQDLAPKKLVASRLSDLTPLRTRQKRNTLDSKIPKWLLAVSESPAKSLTFSGLDGNHLTPKS